jgi:hypothetical protein
VPIAGGGYETAIFEIDDERCKFSRRSQSSIIPTIAIRTVSSVSLRSIPEALDRLFVNFEIIEGHPGDPEIFGPLL